MPRLAATAVPATARTRPIPTAVPTPVDGPFSDEARTANPALAVGRVGAGSAVAGGTADADADGVGVTVAIELGTGEGVVVEGPGLAGWVVRAGAGVATGVATGVAAGVGGAVGRGVAGAAGGAGGGTPGG